MMFKIAWKSFRYNIKNFIVFFLSAVFSVSMIFGFMYLSELTKEISVGGIPSGAGVQLRHSVIAILIVSICIMVYSARTYIRSRMKDYSMLLILGIRKRQFMFFVAMEYLFSWILSTVCGLCCGNLLVLLFRYILYRIAGSEISYSQVDTQSLYIKVLLLCAVMIVGVIIVLIGYLEEKDLSSLLQANIKKEKKPNKLVAKILLGVGVFLAFISVVLATQTDSSFGLPSALVMGMGIAGIYLVIAFGVGIWFERRKKRENSYYKNLLGLNNFHYRFFNNANIIAGQIVVGIFFIYLVWTVSGGIWNTNPAEYPYDFVCTASEEKADVLWELSMKQPGEKQSFAYLGCHYGDVPLIGISQSLSKEILGEEVDLRDNELMYLWGQDGFLFEGNEREMEISVGWDNVVHNNYKFYDMKKEKYNPLFGKWLGSVVVLSDQEYDSLFAEQLENYFMVTINTDQSNVDTVEEALKEQAKRYPEIKIYSKKTLLRLERLEGIVSFSIVLFSAVSLFLYLLFTLCIKVYSDLPDMKERYKFLDTIGMKHKEKRKTIKKEITVLLLPPAAVAAVFGFLYCCAFSMDILRRDKLPFHLIAEYSIPSVLWILPQMLAYMVIMVLFTLIMRQMVVTYIQK